jgi:hypothetical protein
LNIISSHAARLDRRSFCLPLASIHAPDWLAPLGGLGGAYEQLQVAGLDGYTALASQIILVGLADCSWLASHDRGAMNFYAIAEWKDFFVAVSGAAAALAGLLFVALSINLARIVELPGTADRAGETLISLGSVLVAALLGLVPQSPSAFGFELLFVAGWVWFVTTYLHVRAMRLRLYDTPYHGFLRVAFAQTAMLPLVIGAASFLSREGGGLYWLVPGLIPE